jgi:hypothetical protein
MMPSMMFGFRAGLSSAVVMQEDLRVPHLRLTGEFCRFTV